MLSDEIPMIGRIELEVPSLGKVNGISYDNQTSQYLGIPYAEIPGRFRRSVPAKEWENRQWDGTKLGYGAHLLFQILRSSDIMQTLLSPATSRLLSYSSSISAMVRSTTGGRV